MRPFDSFLTSSAISLPRMFIGWVTGKLFAYLYTNSAALARFGKSGKAATAAVAATPPMNSLRVSFPISIPPVSVVYPSQRQASTSAEHYTVSADFGQALCCRILQQFVTRAPMNFISSTFYYRLFL